MPARVKVRAVIWVGDKLVVHRVSRRGAMHVTLPGGRVNERESVSDALAREVLEEVGLAVEIGDLLLAAEVVSGARRQDVELVFEAHLKQEVDPSTLSLVDPDEPNTDVLPPILEQLAERRPSAGRDGARWLGNIYSARAVLD